MIVKNQVSLDDAMTEGSDVDQRIRRLRYDFWRLSRLERLRIIVDLDLISEDQAKEIPLVIYRDAFTEALKKAKTERLAAKIKWIKS